MVMHHVERKMIVLTKYSALAAVLGSLAGALLMFLLGLLSIYDAYEAWLPWSEQAGAELARSAFAVIQVIEALDRFLIAIVLLYFGYGVYSLFIRTEIPEKVLGLPPLLRVRQIGQLKQVVAEVIIVVLFVLFLRTALQTFQRTDGMNWEQAIVLLVLPICTALLALALKLAELHPKPVHAS
jgi:uncharacterized membrane protein YqhA